MLAIMVGMMETNVKKEMRNRLEPAIVMQKHRCLGRIGTSSVDIVYTIWDIERKTVGPNPSPRIRRSTKLNGPVSVFLPPSPSRSPSGSFISLTSTSSSSRPVVELQWHQASVDAITWSPIALATSAVPTMTPMPSSRTSPPWVSLLLNFTGTRPASMPSPGSPQLLSCLQCRQ
ncbi:hypothetical protein RJ639_006924 [Escallonia herrerae]|uniref:Uncharacterized protein n=1 Tax=Escallonia herrerae TaxID=1293975 RepID=A0AA89AXS3_9ASTE|nr:hypothetical protein RJ639_006924 [Escallonia herrerae]